MQRKSAIWFLVAAGSLLVLWMFTTFSIYKMAPALNVAQTARVRADVDMLRLALEEYKLANGAYPSTEQGLNPLAVRPPASIVSARWKQLLSEIPKDPWENEYVYRCPGRVNLQRYDLFSAGPDHVSDTADDDWGR